MLPDFFVKTIASRGLHRFCGIRLGNQEETQRESKARKKREKGRERETARKGLDRCGN